MASGVTGILWRILRCAVECADSASSTKRCEGRSNRGGESAVVCWRVSRGRHVLPLFKRLSPDAGRNLPRWRGAHAGDDDLRSVAAAGFAATARVVDGDAFDLPNSR